MEYYITTKSLKGQAPEQKPEPALHPKDLYEKKSAMYRDLHESIQFFDDIFLEAYQEIKQAITDKKYL